MRQPRVEILYFRGCPNHERARDVVERAANELRLQLGQRAGRSSATAKPPPGCVSSAPRRCASMAATSSPVPTSAASTRGDGSNLRASRRCLDHGTRLSR
jgi:hypothetical protein